MARKQTAPSYNTLDDTAVNDPFRFWEGGLLSSGLLSNNIVTLDVMVNDLEKRPSLYSLDDGMNTNYKQDMLVSNVSTGWELTAAGNLMRIYQGKVQLDLTNSLSAWGLSTVSDLTLQHVLSDSFTYAIQLNDKSLKWATVSFMLQGEGGAGAQDDLFNTHAGEPAWFDVVANDNGSGHVSGLSTPTITTENESGFLAGYTGTLFSLATTDSPSIHFDPGSAFASLSRNEALDVAVDYTVRYATGGESSARLTVTVIGMNDVVELGAVPTGLSLDEDSVNGIQFSLGFTDVDRADTHTAFAGVDPDGLVVLYTEVVGHTVTANFSLLNPMDTRIQALGRGDTLTKTLDLTVSDDKGSNASTQVTLTIVGANEQIRTDGGVAYGTDYADDIRRGDFDQTLNLTLWGNGGNDEMSGGGGDDLLVGGTGNDRLVSGDGNDSLYGGEGNDLLESLGTGNKELDGGDGVDELQSLQAHWSAQTLMFSGQGDDTLALGAGVDDLYFNLRFSPGIDRVIAFDADASATDTVQDHILLLGTGFAVPPGTSQGLSAEDYRAYEDYLGGLVTSGPAVLHGTSGRWTLLYYWDGTDAGTPSQFATLMDTTGTFDAADIIIVGSATSQAL